MNNDAARFDGIEQPIAAGTNNEPPDRFFKHWRHFGMRSEMAQSEIESADKSCACSFAAFFKLGEDLDKVVFGALLPDDFSFATANPSCGGHVIVSKVDRVTFPNAHRLQGRLRGRLTGAGADPITPGLCPAQESLD